MSKKPRRIILVLIWAIIGGLLFAAGWGNPIVVHSFTNPNIWIALAIVCLLSLIGLTALDLYRSRLSKQPPLPRCPMCGQVLPEDHSLRQNHTDQEA